MFQGLGCGVLGHVGNVSLFYDFGVSHAKSSLGGPRLLEMSSYRHMASKEVSV